MIETGTVQDPSQLLENQRLKKEKHTDVSEEAMN